MRDHALATVRPSALRLLSTGSLALVLAVAPLAPLRAATEPLPPTPPTIGHSVSQRVRPTFGSGFQREMRLLVAAIAADAPQRALATFFPEGPYVAMKTGRIPSPATDYLDRLIALFDLDVAAYHRAIYRGAVTRFLRVDANGALAAWVAPGACENSIGYWHLPGTRLVFRRAGRVISVGVDSLISWRGTWYVVHLGPNPRSSNVGTLDQFHVGAGVVGPAGGC